MCRAKEIIESFTQFTYTNKSCKCQQLVKVKSKKKKKKTLHILHSIVWNIQGCENYRTWNIFFILFSLSEWTCGSFERKRNSMHLLCKNSLQCFHWMSLFQLLHMRYTLCVKARSSSSRVENRIVVASLLICWWSYIFFSFIVGHKLLIISIPFDMLSLYIAYLLIKICFHLPFINSPLLPLFFCTPSCHLSTYRHMRERVSGWLLYQGCFECQLNTDGRTNVTELSELHLSFWR